MKRKFLMLTFLSVLSVVSVYTQKKKLPQADQQMLEAYRISGQIIRERMITEDASNKDILDAMTENDLIVIDGEFDHIHLVLPSLALPFTKVNHDQLPEVEFEPDQTVFVNCASSFPPAQAKRLASFVAKGGQLITSDWVLKYVLEKGFPGYVGGNGRYTTDDVVRIEVADTEDPAVKGFLDEETNPVWWLEGISYPIRVLNKNKVKVLVRSEELKEKYGEEAVLIRFEYGKGVVYHMISHFYLQRTEIRDVVQEEKAEKYIIIKGGTRNKKILQQAGRLNYGQIQAANTSSEFIMRAVINHKKKVAQ